MARPAPVYRKPREYVPPYEYCDRWCERCAIDKTRCMTWQSATDAELEAICEGQDPSAAEFTAGQVRESLEDALAMLEEMAREQGLDPGELAAVAEREKAAGRRRGDEGKSPLLEKAMEFTSELMDFLKERRESLDAVEEAQGACFAELYWYHTMPAPKIARITMDRTPADDDPELGPYADAVDILSAQVAHRALVRTEAGLLEIVRALPALTDEVIGFLAKGKALREALEEGWLSRENPLLEPVGDGPWWGPTEDSREALERVREVRRKRKAKNTD